MKKIFGLMFASALIVLSACEKEVELVYKDGTYKAEEASFHYGYKGFLQVTIADDKLTAVDFDYLDDADGRKSETTQQEYNMTPHPSVWVPQYEAALLAASIAPEYDVIDGITGATGAYNLLTDMVEAILDAAITGNTETIIIGGAAK
jgi:major membrane immunogen (membrane-anchored lipoprotein)